MDMEEVAKVNRFGSVKGFEGNGTDLIFDALSSFQPVK